MWNKLLAVNSFVLAPLSFMFMVYSAGMAVFFWHWKLLWISIFIFLIVLMVEAVLAALN